MPAKTPKPPTVADIIGDVLRGVTEPMPVNDLIDRVLQRHESKAKNPRSSVRAKIAEEAGSLLVFVDREHVLPMDVALRGVRFRIPLSELEISEGGFWLLVPRAGGRFREDEIGPCAPDPNYDLDGSAMDIALAGVGLQAGSRLKYVYDFGDWVEHELVVEAIEPPQANVRYPRIVSG